MPRPFLHILLAISVGLAASYYWDPNPAPTTDLETRARQQTLPKTYLHTTRSWSYNEEGSLTNILEADSVEQFSTGDESQIKAPRFYSHSGDDKTWSATADRGRFLHEEQKLLLRGSVVLSHDQTEGRLETEAMNIDLKTKIARSTHEVLITQAQNYTRAEGMIAHLEQETITLMPNVESLYVQPQP
jgi:LPS export ABC transporter protein LptC